MRRFRDRVAVVTGAASGIGRAMAGRFAAEGMRVVLADIEQDALDRAAGELRSEGATAIGVRTDVAAADSAVAARDDCHLAAQIEHLRTRHRASPA